MSASRAPHAAHRAGVVRRKGKLYEWESYRGSRDIWALRQTSLVMSCLVKSAFASLFRRESCRGVRQAIGEKVQSVFC